MGCGPHLLAALDFRSLPEQVVNGLFAGAIYALIALGYTMVYGILRLINFAHGEVYMLGAYVSLFVSRWLGFGPDSNRTDSSILNLAAMLLASMIVCALVGVCIERFAYRPMRRHSRIASLITAIGVSLFLQYAGALFLPNSPPPSINEKVNPYRGSIKWTLVQPSERVKEAVSEAKAKYERADAPYEAYLKAHPDASEFNLPKSAQPLRDAMTAARQPYYQAESDLASAGISITMGEGNLIIFFTSIGLMLVLTFLVMRTKQGRAMRAVSHDFDSASLMGVNVGNTILFTFILGSALAGAGAMMQVTFKATTLTTFLGVTPGVKAFVAAVLGGIGNIPGAVLGGMLMGVAEDLVIWTGYGNYADAIAFVILIVVLLFRPGGLLGSSKVEKV